MKTKNIQKTLLILILNSTLSIECSWFKSEQLVPLAQKNNDLIQQLYTQTARKAATEEEFEYLNYLENENYVKTYKNSSFPVPKFDYIHDTDDLLDKAEDFWERHLNHIVKLFNLEDRVINHVDLVILVQACDLGRELEKYKLLEIFDTHYNMLSVIINHASAIRYDKQLSENDETLLELKRRVQLYMQSLYDNLPTSSKALISREANKAQEIARKKQQNLEPYPQTTRIHAPQSINDYVHKRGNRNDIKRNLQNYDAISNVRGEGNCGYRAFLGSICMNSIKNRNFASLRRLEELLTTEFVPLFKKYAHSDSHSNYTLSVPDENSTPIPLNFTNEEIENIQIYLIQSLHRIKSYTLENQVKDHFNKNPEFDFFMIMFLRAVIIAEILEEKNADILMQAIISRDEEPEYQGASSEQKRNIYINGLLQWTTWIDQPELQILNQITHIPIHLVQQDALKNAQVDLEDQQFENIGNAHILFCTQEGHYKILHPKN